MQYCNYSINEPFQRLGTLEDFFRGSVKSLVRHIVRRETRGKVVRVMTFAAHNPFMELHAVDFDRNQSDSMELAMGSFLHH